jgi:hypothetical protein
MFRCADISSSDTSMTRMSALRCLILPRNLKGYVGKTMTGLVGDGIAYLQMVRDGDRWVDHFENHGVYGKRPTTRSRDYVFSRSGNMFVALAESRATKGASRAAFTKTVRERPQGAGRALSGSQNRFLGSLTWLCDRQLDEICEEGGDIHRPHGR